MKKKSIILLLAALLALGASGAQALSYTLDDESSEVSLIQQALLKLDFYYGDITGHYGARTQRGIRMFQKEYGLEMTGIADDETRARLYAAAGIQAPPVSDALIEMNVTLRRGDSGSAVTWLQESLTALGYYEGEITGSYGGLTHEAVRLFQIANGQEADGEAGDRMQSALYSVSAIRFGSGRYPTLVRGDQGLALIKTLQQRLKDLGYYTI